MYKRQRQQGEKRYCPHHGTSDNQRYCGAVQLQADHPENPLGCERQPSQRQEQGGKGHQPRFGQHQGADHQALPETFRPRGVRDGGNGAQEEAKKRIKTIKSGYSISMKRS